jgi:O-succinylbenzoate synthase
MKISIFPYRLINNGALIKIEDEKGSGYTDLHPWVELGDAPLKEQLKTLHTNQSVLERAITDQKARFEKKSLFEGLTLPKSHYFLQDHNTNLVLVQKMGFTHVKVKKPSLSLLNALPRGMKWRIDFNECLDLKTFENFLKKAPLDQIDFIEDPIPFDVEQWTYLQSRYKVSLACDRNISKGFGHREAAKVVVVKPVRDGSCFFNTTQRVVVTSYLDHPVGQLWAAYVAALHTSKEICGLCHHLIFPENPFSRLLNVVEARLSPPKGFGIGFDELLKNLHWEPL